MPSHKASEPVLPGHLEHGNMMNLLGYHLAQASIPTDHAFKKHISETYKLNKLEFTILMLLQANPQLTSKRMTVALNIAAPNLTLILDRLENRQLLTRVRSEEDRRVQHVCLTPAGAALNKKLVKICATMEDNIWKHVTVAEQQILLELLRKVAQHRKI